MSTITGVTAGTDTIIYTVSNICGTTNAEKIIDILDCVSEVKNISKPSENITLYPNPTQNNITITASFLIKKVEISNLLGQIVFSGLYDTKEAVITLNELLNGLYFITINDTNVYKVVKR